VLDAVAAVGGEPFGGDLANFAEMYRVLNGDSLEPIRSLDELAAWRETESKYIGLVTQVTEGLSAGRLMPLGRDLVNDPGSYYRFDSRSVELRRLFSARPMLEGRRLATTTTIRFPDADGGDVPAYLTLPVESPGSQLAAVILPRGPQPRDDWGFDWLTQFLAARGYAVLQVDFEGSEGFSEDWTGDGGFAAWQRVVGDLEHGRKWLIAEGIADPSLLVRREDDERDRLGSHRPELGNGELPLAQQLKEQGLERVIDLVDLVDEENARLVLVQQRAKQGTR